ncbi:MAG: tRNA pseudouridine(38-40) synthase TruA [Blastocatellia bacterium]
MRTLKLTLEYDGTRYSGWQTQANAKTVAGTLQQAAEQFFERSVELGGAGRTDAGVHALAQVAHLKFPRWGGTPAANRQRIERLRVREIMHGINDLLPADINLLKVEEASPSFHARHDALLRSYIYRISLRRTAFDKKYVWWIKDQLDTETMGALATKLAGKHDFSAFSERDPRREDQSPLVKVIGAQLSREDHLLTFQICASHFLWKMVRRLVGSLVEVGRGRATSEDFCRLLDRSPRGTGAGRLDPARVTAPPSGLFLEEIVYRQ